MLQTMYFFAKNKRSSHKTAPSVNNPIKQKNIPYLECLSNKNAEPDSLHLPYILMRLSAIYFAETIITRYLLFVIPNNLIHYRL